MVDYRLGLFVYRIEFFVELMVSFNKINKDFKNKDLKNEDCIQFEMKIREEVFVIS